MSSLGTIYRRVKNGKKGRLKLKGNREVHFLAANRGKKKKRSEISKNGTEI